MPQFGVWGPMIMQLDVDVIAHVDKTYTTVVGYRLIPRL